eukprot:scaffold74617_cov34-Tisochrysis_lutea.AAC.5
MRLHQLADGLLHVSGFLTASEHTLVFEQARRLSDAVSVASRDLPRNVSPLHNIQTREEYASVQLSSGASCDHFERYADGHRLTYFRQCKPFPDLGLPDIQLRVASLPGIDAALRHDRERAGKAQQSLVSWRLTLNRYPPARTSTLPESPRSGTFSSGNAGSLDATRPGFPWHRDLRANGAVSVIVGLGSPTSLEFGDEVPSDGHACCNRRDVSSLGKCLRNGEPRQLEHVSPGCEVLVREEVRLAPGDAVALTGRARWEMLHRVVPELHGRLRLSLVFGLW